MAEAIISRSTAIPESLPVAPGYHTVGVTVRDYDGKVLPNFRVQCTDGAAFYNYTTNEKGKCVFMVNSGAANIYANNYTDNGYKYIDFKEPGWFNLDAPVGLTQTLNINLESAIPDNGIYEFLSSQKFALVKERTCDLYIVGGGGGGGGTLDDEGYPPGSGFVGGGGGGAGYLNNYYNQVLNGEFDFVCGSGGRGGFGWNLGSGASGGTSYIVNSGYQAVGGGGGIHCWKGASGGAGGLGKGGNGTKGDDLGSYTVPERGGDSPVSFAGGGGSGGGGWSYWAGNRATKSHGSPYGAYTPTYGGGPSRGGGGYGGGTDANGRSYDNGGAGAAGLLRLEFK